MNVIYIGTLDSNAGGPAMSTYLTLYGLRQLDVNAEIVMPPLSKNGYLRGEKVPIYYSSCAVERKFSYIFSLKNLISSLGVYDIYHAQGIWQYPTYALVDVAKKMRKPYLITPRGMLYPQDIAKSSTLFKKVSLKWRLLKDLNNAACIHVTCNEEMKHCRDLGITSPIAVVPNPVEIKDYMCDKQDDIFRLGYLGRLSPRKNVESLIYAFAELKEETKNAELLIIGGGDDQYEFFLKSEVNRLGLNNVVFTGFLNGEDKDKALASCSVLAMPSEFENLGNVVLEGLVRKIPCIATNGSPWEELNTESCGWQVPYNQQEITNAVRLALHTSKEELKKMGERGYNLMKNRYSVEIVSQNMKLLYEWILGGRQPEFVFL